MNSAEARLHALGLALDQPPPGVGAYVPARRYGDVVKTSSISGKDGPRLRYLGKLGAELEVAQGRESARMAMVNCLAALRSQVGSLDAVAAVVGVTGYVASAEGFVQQHEVLDGASELVLEIFGPEIGQHVRAAIGVFALPNNCSVGVELTVALHPGGAQ